MTTKKSESSTNLLVFKAISDFIDELADSFASKHKPLKLYKRLLKFVKVTDEEHIAKHVRAFTVFCTTNKDAIENRDSTKFKEPVVTFSPRVFISFDYIFSLADKETAEVIWEHLLTISALVVPSGHAKDILRNSKVNEILGDGSSESDFVSGIINAVQNSNGDPSAAVSSVLGSDMFKGLLSGLGSDGGEGLDLSKFAGIAQKMVSVFAEQSGGEGLPIDMSQIGTLLSSLSPGLAPAQTEPLLTLPDADEK